MIGFLYRIADRIRRRYLRADTGRLGEDLAHSYLRRQGCKIVARNYRARSGAGEVDLVVWDRETLVFVEVKTRKNADFGAPELAVDAEKRERVETGARAYTRRANLEFELARFDIVSIIMEPRVAIEWLRDAYSPHSPR
jgi:putative endonuclease